MEFIVVAFKSRAHSVKFYNLLNQNGVNAQIVNTPKEAGVGCGLSVKLNKNRLQLVKNVVLASGLSSFAGIFSVRQVGGATFVRPI